MKSDTIFLVKLSNSFFNFLFQGYTHPREYIVTEWPLQTTCSDIWSLVYDHDCSALVVLCNPTSTVSNVSFIRNHFIDSINRAPQFAAHRSTRPSGPTAPAPRSTAKCSRLNTSRTSTTPTSGPGCSGSTRRSSP